MFMKDPYPYPNHRNIEMPLTHVIYNLSCIRGSGFHDVLLSLVLYLQNLVLTARIDGSELSSMYYSLSFV